MRHVSLSVWIWLGSLCVLCVSASCADNSTEQVPKMGRLEVALTSTSSSGAQYRLRNGTFRITGTSTKTLSSDAQPDAPTLTAELTAGGYSIELATGWSLQKRTASGSFESVKAALGSANPVAFTIVDQQSTSVLYRFKVGDDVVQFGNGRLVIGIDVDDQPGDGSQADAGDASDASDASDAVDAGPRCFVSGECKPSQSCGGAHPGKICVPEQIYCDASQPCLQRSAGCSEHRCLPPLPLGSPCSDAHMCESAFCNPVSGVCEASPPSDACCDLHAINNCPDGFVCAHEGLMFNICFPSGKCIPAIAGQGERCQDRQCADGLICWFDELPPAYCYGPRRHLDETCDDLREMGTPLISRCVAGLYCPVPPDGVGSCQDCMTCQPLPGPGDACPVVSNSGAAVDCRDDSYCGADKICHLKPAYGEDCASVACQPGLRCADAVLDGTCSGGDDAGGTSNEDAGMADGADGTNDPGMGLPFTAVSVGASQYCGLRTNGVVSCWGSRSQHSQPGQNFVAVAAGDFATCGLLQDKTAVCWGDPTYGNTYGQLSSVPSGAFTAISGRNTTFCGLRPDGTVVCWGLNYRGGATPPAGSFVAIDVAYDQACGLRRDGHVVCWGDDSCGQSSKVPDQTFIAVSTGLLHTCALKTDGTLLCWGCPSWSQSPPPSGQTFVTISMGDQYGCALTSDGSATCWGWNDVGQASPPAGQKFVAISAGTVRTCGLKQDGSIACWGYDANGESSPPQ